MRRPYPSIARQVLPVVTALAMGSAVFAQTPSADPKPLLEQAEAAMVVDPKIALRLAGQARDALAQRSAGDTTRVDLARALWLEGEASGRLGDLASAEKSLLRALPLVEAAGQGTALHGRILMSRGATALDKGEVQTAFTSFRDAFAMFARLSDTRNQALALQSIGQIYVEAGDYRRVLDTYARSAEIHPADDNLTLFALNNTGLAYKELGQLERAEADFRRAMALARKINSPMLQTRILTNIATVQLARQRFDQAAKTVNTGLALAAGDAAGSAPFLWGVKAQIAFKRGNMAAAAAMLDRGFAGTVPEKTNFYFRDFHQTASDVYVALGQPEVALRHLRAVNRLDGEMREIRSSTNAALMAAQFDYSAQELRITKLKSGQLERDVALARSRARTQLVALGATLLLLVAMLIAFFKIRRSRNETQVANVQLGKALAAKSEFLATTSHEIRTPLNGIMGMTQVLLGNRSLAPEIKERVELIDGAGKAMKAIVDDLLDMAKIEAGEVVIERGDIELPALLDEIARFWKAEAEIKGLTVAVDLSEGPKYIHEDMRKLRQIVSNLMSNAVKFTVTGNVTLAACVTGGRLQVVIADTGIGMPEDQLEAIFESFHQIDGATTRQHSGTGLGLAISRKLARELDGDIAVTSVLGAGSRFVLSLPLHAVETPAVVERSEGEPLSLATANVVLIETNPLFQSLIGACLEGQVRSCTAVESADAGKDLVAAADLVIMDLATVAEADVPALTSLMATPRILFLSAPGSDAAAFAPHEGFSNCFVAKALPPLNIVPALEGLIATPSSPLKKVA